MDAVKPDTTKHGLAAGADIRPENADTDHCQGWEHYSSTDHATWKTLFERQTKLLPGRACDEPSQGMRDLPIGADAIPDFRRLSEVLMKRTGWQVVAVPGLVPDDVFFDHRAGDSGRQFHAARTGLSRRARRVP
ncbi:MAG: hypothetical protein R3E99_13540 [Burkholderiaceae bacterium]